MTFIDPLWMERLDYVARDDRALISAVADGVGVFGSSHLVASSGGALSSSIAAGKAAINWTASEQGSFLVENVGNEIVQHEDHESSPRIDQVVLTAEDAELSGGLGESRVYARVLKGIATGGTSLNSRAGAAALPANSLRLADVLVPATSGVFTYRDRRLWAKGASAYITATNGNVVLSGTANASGSVRLECSGRPMVATYSLQLQFVIAGGGTVNVSAQMDAATVPGGGVQSVRYDSYPFLHPVSGSIPFVPTAGSHLFNAAVQLQVGNVDLLKNASNPVHFSIRELPYNANNGTS